VLTKKEGIKIKILFTRAGDALLTDGINVFIYELADALIDLGHEVYILSLFARGLPPGENQAHFHESAQRLFSVKNVPTSIRLQSTFTPRSPLAVYVRGNVLFATKGSIITKELNPDFVIFNGATTMFCPYLKVAVCHDFQFRVQFNEIYDKILYRTFDGIIAPSSEIKQELIRQFKLPSEKTAFIPICINTQNFMSKPLKKRQHAILHVGTRREKRPDVTISSFEKIADADSKIRLFVTGPLPDSNSTLYTQINSLRKNIKDRVVFLGRISKEELTELYSSVKVVCVPSDYKLPVCSPTVSESLAAGTPVVGSLSAISKDILINKNTGFRVPSYDIQAFSSKLFQLTNDDFLWKKMSLNAIKIAHICDKKTVALEYLKLYSYLASCK